MLTVLLTGLRTFLNTSKENLCDYQQFVIVAIVALTSELICLSHGYISYFFAVDLCRHHVLRRLQQLSRAR